MSRRTGRRLAWGAGLLLVLVGVWALASVLAGRHAAATLEALAHADDPQASLRVRALRHEAGWFRSEGTLELHWVDDCASGGPDEPLLSAQVRYRIVHQVLPGALLRFDWTLEPSAASARSFERLFGARVSLSGEGLVGYSGDLSTSLSLPAWERREGGERLAMAASRGTLSWGARRLGLDWRAPRLSLQGRGATLDLEGLALEVHLRDRLRGTGRTQIALDRLSGPSWRLEGLQTRSEVTERGDRLDASLSQSVRSLNWGAQEVRELAVEASVRDLHLPSVETLSRLAGQSCGFARLSAEEAQRFRGALRTLLLEGFSMGLTRLAGSAGQGQVEGDLTVELQRAGAAASAIALAKSLRLDARLRLKGEVLSAEQRASVLELGLLRETPQGLQAELSLQQGQLQANGRALESGFLRVGLEATDARLNALLGETGAWRARTRPGVAPGGDEDEDASRPQAAPEPLGPPDVPKR